MDMNELEFVLNKIIEIDTKASQVKKDTAETIKENEKKMNDQLKELQSSGLNESKTEMDEHYQEVMEKAKIESDKIIKDSVDESKSMIENYNSLKDSLKSEILKEIINSN